MHTIRWNMNGQEIERESFSIIDAECAALRQSLPDDQWRVARRLIHTTADASIAAALRYRNNALPSGRAALQRGCRIICDAKMIRSGISLEKLRRVNPAYSAEHVLCAISDADVIARAKAENRTRALCAAEKLRPVLDGAVILIGNAPLALARIVRYTLEESVQPALLIAMPVGFVNVLEAKALLAQSPVPHIVLEGRRGGSTLAVATLHAVLETTPLAQA